MAYFRRLLVLGTKLVIFRDNMKPHRLFQNKYGAFVFKSVSNLKHSAKNATKIYNFVPEIRKHICQELYP